MVGLMFDGRKLEVSFDIEDCGDAWFPTTIREYLGNLSFLVEYWSKKIGDKAQNLKVNTTSLHIRPCPPVLEDKRFTLFEKVEAFFDFGWWSGVITKELEDSRYIVFLKQIKKHKKFHQSELRPHMEWKNGKWFTSSQVCASFCKLLNLLFYLMVSNILIVGPLSSFDIKNIDIILSSLNYYYYYFFLQIKIISNLMLQ